jgi:hypothetical protein
VAYKSQDDDILSIYKRGAEVIPLSEIDTALIPDFESMKNAK